MCLHLNATLRRSASGYLRIASWVTPLKNDISTLLLDLSHFLASASHQRTTCVPSYLPFRHVCITHEVPIDSIARDRCDTFQSLSHDLIGFFLVKLLGICYYGELRAVCLPQGVIRSIVGTSSNIAAVSKFSPKLHFNFQAQAAYGKQCSGRPGIPKKRPVIMPIVACQSEA